jgi:hypothetical protein
MTDPVGIDVSIPTELPPEVAAQIESTATTFVERLVSLEPGSPAFRRAISMIDGLGDREVRSTTQIVAAFQDRPTRALQVVLAHDAPLRRNLAQLRETASQLARGASREGSSGEDVAAAVRRAEHRIREVVPALDADRQALEQDNAALTQQERALWTEIQTLRRYASLAGRLDELIDDAIERSDDEPRRARALRDEALHAIRRRRRDLLLQLAVALQAYAALRLIEHDNLEVVWAIRAATTTTVTALRTALLASQATAHRPLGDATDLHALARAWTDVLASVDQVDDRRRRVLAEIDQPSRHPSAGAMGA